MSEWNQGGVAVLKLLLIGLFATCYWIGGRRWKGLRRYVGGIILAGGVIGLALLQHRFHWWYALAVMSYPLALSQGYGAETPGRKILRRLGYGIGMGVAAMPFVIPHAWILWSYQLGLAVSSSLVLGVLNPVAAVDEETLIATLSVLCVPFMV